MTLPLTAQLPPEAIVGRRWHAHTESTGRVTGTAVDAFHCYVILEVDGVRMAFTDAEVIGPAECPVCDRDHATTPDPMGALIDCLRRAVTAAGPDATVVRYAAPAGPRPAVCPNDLADRA